MTDQENGKFVNTLLDGEHLADFYRIKAYHGINTNSDVVRFLIRKEARRLTAAHNSAVNTIIDAYIAENITAEEAMSALAGQGVAVPSSP